MKPLLLFSAVEIGNSRCLSKLSERQSNRESESKVSGNISTRANIDLQYNQYIEEKINRNVFSFEIKIILVH